MDDLYGLVRLILRLSRRVHHVLDDPLETALGLNTKELLVLATVMDGADTPSAVAQAQKHPDVLAHLAAQGTTPLVMGPDELKAYIGTETTKWSRLAREANIQAE